MTPTVGDQVTAEPIVPATARATTGLVAPDGIVGTIESYPGAPKGARIVIYTEKLVNKFAPTSTTAAVGLGAGPFTIPVGSTSGLLLSGGSITISLGSTNGMQSVTCTGETASPASLTGCGGGTGSVIKGSLVGEPGACVAPLSTLSQIGEGKSTAKSLFGNNEDFTDVRAAYTYNGIDLTDLGPVNGIADLRAIPRCDGPGRAERSSNRGATT